MSIAPVPWTLLFTGVFALLQFGLSLVVIRQRVRSRVALGDGDDEHLLSRIRAHGNFIETVPMGLMLMLVLELSQVDTPWLLALGGGLLTGRIVHAASLLGWGGHPARMAGMALTLATLSLGGLGCLAVWQA